MRILLAGSPDIAIPSLLTLANKYEVCAVLTAPDRPAGRGRKMTAPPVKDTAIELGIPVLQPVKLNTEARNQIAEYKPDLMAVVAFSKIFGPKFLSLFPAGALNVHPSLLPLYRGPAPIPAAILHGDSHTGVTVQFVGLEMDAGAILLQEQVTIGDHEPASALAKRLGILGAELLECAVAGISDGSVDPKEQDHSSATYCSLIDREDARINWNSSALEIDRLVRAYDTWPTAFTVFAGARLSIYKAHIFSSTNSREPAIPGEVLGVDKAEGILVQTKQGILAVEDLQLQARKRVGWKDFMNGVAGFSGSILGGD